jgi:hypothetical protein
MPLIEKEVEEKKEVTYTEILELLNSKKAYFYYYGDKASLTYRDSDEDIIELNVKEILTKHIEDLSKQEK